jgi:hypothetical protein
LLLGKIYFFYKYFSSINRLAYYVKLNQLNCYKIREFSLKYSAEFYLSFSLRACFIFWGRRRRRFSLQNRRPFSLQNRRRCSLISYLSLPLRQNTINTTTTTATSRNYNNGCKFYLYTRLKSLENS